MLGFVQTRLATVATLALSAGQIIGSALFAMCLVLVGLPVDASATSSAAAKSNKGGAHGKADPDGAAAADSVDPDAP